MHKIYHSALRIALAICAIGYGAFSYAVERPLEYAYAAFQTAVDLPAVGAKLLELTLAGWRTGSEPSAVSLGSNMRAQSNHFVMASVTPVGSYGLQLA